MRSGLVARIKGFSGRVLRRRLKLWQEHLPRNEAFFVHNTAEIRERLRQMKPGDRDESESPESAFQNMSFGNLWELFFAFARTSHDENNPGEQQGDTESRSAAFGSQAAGPPMPGLDMESLKAGSQTESESVSDFPRSDNQNREPGRPLAGLLRQRMERRMGMNLAEVRIHTNAETTRQLRSADVDALSVGDDIHFAPGKYDPESRRGRALLVHELTHVRQKKEGVDSDAQLNTSRIQQLEQQALHNENTTLRESSNPSPGIMPSVVRRRVDKLPRAGISAAALHPPAPVLFNPAFWGLASIRNNGTTGQTVQNAPLVMAAASDRALDTGSSGTPPATETALPQRDDLSEAVLSNEEIYDTLKWRLRIEKERSGD